MPVIRVDATAEGGRTTFGLYFGPKDRAALAQAGHDLDRSIDFGYFWFIALPLLEALRLLHDLTRNWGIAIIILTTLVKVATIPLTQATHRQMKEMQKIQPQMQRIRERFKDDSEALQREMQDRDGMDWELFLYDGTHVRAHRAAAGASREKKAQG